MAGGGDNKEGFIDDRMDPSFDGKRMRKAINRKTIDYNPTIIHYLENRVYQRGHRGRHLIQPDATFSSQLIPPSAMLDNPMNCVTTKFVRTSTNKFRCPIFCLAWTPEGRRLVTGASSGEFTLWNGLTFNFETILQAHDESVRAMRWSHNDQWMVTADHAGYVKYWQSNMNNVKMYQGHKEPIRGVRLATQMQVEASRVKYSGEKEPFNQYEKLVIAHLIYNLNKIFKILVLHTKATDNKRLKSTIQKYDIRV